MKLALFLKSLGAVVDRHGQTLKEIKLESMCIDILFDASRILVQCMSHLGSFSFLVCLSPTVDRFTQKLFIECSVDVFRLFELHEVTFKRE
jgi:hypothetical protein